MCSVMCRVQRSFIIKMFLVWLARISNSNDNINTNILVIMKRKLPKVK